MALLKAAKLQGEVEALLQEAAQLRGVISERVRTAVQVILTNLVAVFTSSVFYRCLAQLLRSCRESSRKGRAPPSPLSSHLDGM